MWVSVCVTTYTPSPTSNEIKWVGLEKDSHGKKLRASLKL